MRPVIDEFETRLRRHLDAVDDVGVRSVSSTMASAERAGRRIERRRRVATGTASVALAVGVVAVLATVGSGGDERAGSGAPSVVAGQPDASTDAVVPPTIDGVDDRPRSGEDIDVADVDGDPVDEHGLSAWSALPPDPAGPRSHPQVVWTGAEAIAVYGTDQLGDGSTEVSAYIPSTGQWRPVADPPVTGPMAALHTDPLVVWTGEEMLMIGGRAGPLGEPARAIAYGSYAYEPHSDTWRTIASPEGSGVDATHPWAWTGDELLVWPNSGPVAYDPEGDDWRDLAAPPLAARAQASTVWTGAEWVVWGGRANGEDLADGAAYDPVADSWRTIAPSPLSARRSPAVWTGSEMLLAAGSSGNPASPQALTDGAAYDPVADSWRSIARGFGHPGFVPVWTGTHLVMFAKGGAVVYDPANDSWVDVCCRDTGGGAGGTPVWTGTSIVLIGSHTADAGGSVFTIRAEPTSERTIAIDVDIDEPSVTSIGAVRVRLPDDSFEVPFNPMRVTEPGARGETLSDALYVNTWSAESCDCVIGMAVVHDPGDDAPLYGHLAEAERIPSDYGRWMVDRGTEQPGEPTVAMLRIDGVLIQVSTVDAESDAVLTAVIDSVELQPR